MLPIYLNSFEYIFYFKQVTSLKEISSSLREWSESAPEWVHRRTMIAVFPLIITTKWKQQAGLKTSKNTKTKTC